VSHGDGKGKDRPSWLDLSWIEGRTEARMCASYRKSADARWHHQPPLGWPVAAHRGRRL